MSLVALGAYHDQFEAEIVAGRLRAAGIEAVVFDGNFVSAYGAGLPVRLMVLDEDLKRAKTLIARDAGAEPVDRGPWSDLSE